MPRRNLWIILLAAAVSYLCYVRAEHAPYARYLASAFRTIDRHALEDPPDRPLFDAALEGMVAQLHELGDEHSEYITAAEAAEFNAEITQEFGGVGIRIMLRGEEPPREVVIISPPEPGHPAAEHDIRARDRIMAVDGVPVATMNTEDSDEILRRIRGPVGKPVKLSILHVGDMEPVDIQVVRGRITTESIVGIRKRKNATWQFRLDDHPQIAYIRIDTFGERTPAEIYEVVSNLVREGLQGLVLDVRGNPGGELHGTIAICDLFLPAGKVIVQTRDRRGRLYDDYRASSETPFPDLPLAVLINRYSASASEILAACMQDHARAAVIGERTYGKGTVQQIINVGPPVLQGDEYESGMLKLTASSYWRPSGKNIHRMPGEAEENEWGVLPDLGREVKLDSAHMTAMLVEMQRRELYNPSGDAVLDDLEKLSPDVQALLPFQDEALAKAAEYLKSH